MAAPRGANSLRIIAGQWRGRRLTFPAIEGVRPSPDRVRETLFNWLQPWLPGARCLDLFAGSGAVGLEALSRGAAVVAFVDRDRRVTAAIEAHLHTLGSDAGCVITADALRFLERPAEPYDIVFLDPPFRQGLLAPCCEALAGGWVHSGSRVYLEAEKGLIPELPPGWKLERSKQAGQVGFHLATVA